jgi:hypothetical protein
MPSYTSLATLEVVNTNETRRVLDASSASLTLTLNAVTLTILDQALTDLADGVEDNLDTPDSYAGDVYDFVTAGGYTFNELTDLARQIRAVLAPVQV